jgi:hypothetical protein
MNALDKVKNVQNGLNCCGSYSHLCSACPYKERGECERELHKDALEVIDALKAELKKRTSKATETMPGFITLTAGTAYSSDGRVVVMTENGKIAIRVDGILSVSDLVDVKGSEVRLDDTRQTVFYVCESIEEILGKVAKGEEE